MTAPEITLEKAKQSLNKPKVFRASDFLTTEQVEEVHKANAKGKKRRFNEIDAYIAEIIARFGYGTYKAWKDGEISETDMVRYVEAERAREIQSNLILETIIVAANAGSNNPTKSGQSPKSLKMAIKMLKKQQEKAKGEF